MHNDIEQTKQQDPWSSIVDLMSALVLVLFLAVIFFITNYSEVTQRLDEEHQNLLIQTDKLKKSETKFSNLNQAYSDLKQKEYLLTTERDQLQQDKILLQQQRSQLELDKKRLENDKLSLNSDLQKLQSDKQKLQKDKIALNSDLQKLQNDKRKLELDQVALNSSLQKLQTNINSLEKRQVDLQQESNQLKKQRDSLKTDKKNLLNDTSRLNLDKNRLQQEKSSLNDEKLTLLKKQSQLEQEKAQLLADQKSLIANKEKLQSDTERLNATIIALKAKMREVLQTQNRMMSSLDQAFKQAKAQGVEVDKEGGKIIMKSEVLFTKSQADLSDSGRKELSKVAQVLDKVVRSSKFTSMIEGIMIEGHTSSEGKVNKNFDLSSERSLNALKYLLSLAPMQRNKKLYQSLLFAAAFGESRPVLRNNKEDKILSRRIEIRLIFNQSHMKKLTYELSEFK